MQKYRKSQFFCDRIYKVRWKNVNIWSNAGMDESDAGKTGIGTVNTGIFA